MHTKHKHTYIRAEEAKARMVVWSGAADSRDRETPWQDEGQKPMTDKRGQCQNQERILSYPLGGNGKLEKAP